MCRDMKQTVLRWEEAQRRGDKNTRMALCRELGWPSTGTCSKTPKATIVSSQPDPAKFRSSTRMGATSVETVQGVERGRGRKPGGRDGAECFTTARRNRPNTVPRQPKGVASSLEYAVVLWKCQGGGRGI